MPGTSPPASHAYAAANMPAPMVVFEGIRKIQDTFMMFWPVASGDCREMESSS